MIGPPQPSMQVFFLLHREMKAVWWIRSGFKADPDPAFLVNTGPDADPEPDPRF
jgi:hypothetical protein